MSAGDPNQSSRPSASSVTDAAAVPLARRFAQEDSALRTSLRRFERMWSGHSAPRLPMVRWWDPPQLLRTGIATLVSHWVGVRSDARLTLALAAQEREYYDCTSGAAGARSEIWIDYLCDTGDGWNSTYAVAWAASQPTLELRASGAGRAWPTRRGDVLILGGDEVYPAPSRVTYAERLIAPYEQACGASCADPLTGDTPEVFAIPGNHDWYDGLSAFTRLFCTDVGGRRFAGWRTRQRRSYFALRLPGRWWLLGSDSQLQADIDTAQIEYFREIAEHHMQRGDRAILCLSQPTWIHAHKYRQFGGSFDETDLLYLREEVFAPRGIEIKLFLAGDLHHYRRHEELAPLDGSPIQKITSGGGGAFLHPTHDEDVTRIAEEETVARGEPREYQLQTSYPAPRQSARLAWRNLLFAWKNPSFGIVPALLYSMTAWMFAATVDYRGAAVPLDALELTKQAFLANPALALWIALVSGVFVLFTDTHSKFYKVAGGLGHAAAHWAALFYLGWGAAHFANWLLPTQVLGSFVSAGLLVFAGSWIAGSVVTGLYLLVSLNLFGRHSEEAFSALRIEDYKHFLRLHVRADGALTLYPVKIERVPRRWRARAAGDASPSRVQPAEPLVPELIEPPIVIPAGRSVAGTA